MDRKILIVDDEKNIVDIIAFNLKKEGYTVITAADGEEGVQKAMEENPDLAYVVPKEGSNMWFDSIVVTKDCQNMDAAYRFINFLCDPEVAAKNSEYIGYSTPNKEALVYLDLGDKTDLYNQLWEKVKVN